MRTKSRAFSGRATKALIAMATITGGVVAVSGPASAVLAVPTISTVYVSGSSTNRVVTAGTTVVITGSGFTGMTDNAFSAGCSIAPVAYPASGSGCSQVRFVGLSATATTGYTLATRYTVVSDSMIYATVPTITPVDGTSVGSPAAGTGSVKVQVVNTTGTGTSSLLSASTSSEVFYRGPLTAVVSGLVPANPMGGGTLTVGVTGVAALTANTFPLEKITGYLMSTAANSPSVVPTSVAFKDATNVTVVLPPGQSAGNLVDIVLVHDGIIGVADADSLSYAAVITKLESCTQDVSPLATTVTIPLPVCTGTANAPGTNGSTADIKVTGKGFTGATVWSFDGAGGTVVETCAVISDTLAYCHLAITTVPNPPVAAVSYTPADPPGDSTTPTLIPTVGSILIYSSLV